jgi:hypothetical protein
VRYDARQTVMAGEERHYFIVLYQVFKNGAGWRYTILAEALQSGISTPAWGATPDSIRPANVSPMETKREGQG